MASTIWRGHITFGLVSIPVRLYRAARSEKVSLRELYRAPKPAGTEPEAEPEPTAPAKRRQISTRAQVQPEPEETTRTAEMAAEPVLSRIKLNPITDSGGERVSRTDLVKGYEYEKGRYVVLEPAELESIAAETAREMQIQEFVRMADVDPIYLETSYYVAPESSGEKAYALLFEALHRTGYVGIAQFAMHRREHVVLVRPGSRGITAHTMYYEQEVRKDLEYTANKDLLTPKEVELASTLVEALAGPFEPEKYHDTYREKLEALIADRMKGKPPVIAQEKRTKAPVVDIMEALQKSLQATKKPPARQAAETTRKTHKRTRG